MKGLFAKKLINTIFNNPVFFLYVIMFLFSLLLVIF